MVQQFGNMSLSRVARSVGDIGNSLHDLEFKQLVFTIQEFTTVKVAVQNLESNMALDAEYAVRSPSITTKQQK